MARDTDRKKISEAVRLSGAWTFRAYGDEHYLTKPGESDERLVIPYGTKGPIVEADHCFPGVRNGITTRKRKRVLAIIEGKR
jgi:hypothetical protein